MWSDPLVGRPENEMTGVSFTHGGYARINGAPTGSGGYTLWRPGHWALDGLELMAGDLLGTAKAVIGYECDGCEMTLVDGRPVPTGRDGTPIDFEIVATAPAHLWATDEAPAALPDHYIGELNWVAARLGGADTPEMRERFAYGRAVMGSFRRGGGEVFTTGCTDWAYGLGDPQVDRVTINVLRHFGWQGVGDGISRSGHALRFDQLFAHPFGIDVEAVDRTPGTSRGIDARPVHGQRSKHDHIARFECDVRRTWIVAEVGLRDVPADERFAFAFVGATQETQTTIR